MSSFFLCPHTPPLHIHPFSLFLCVLDSPQNLPVSPLTCANRNLLSLAQVDLILLHTHKDTHICTHLQFRTSPTLVSSPVAPPRPTPSHLRASPHRPAAGRHALNHSPPMPAPCHACSPRRPAQGFCSEARQAQLLPPQPWVPATLAGCGRRQAVLLPCTNLQRRARCTICSGNNSNV